MKQGATCYANFKTQFNLNVSTINDHIFIILLLQTFCHWAQVKQEATCEKELQVAETKDID